FGAFILKLDPNGNFGYINAGLTIQGNIAPNTGLGIVVDNTGTAYVTGSYGAQTNFGTFHLDSLSSRDVFVAQLNPDGAFAGAVGWQANAAGGGTPISFGMGIALDPQGNVLTTGVFSGTVNFRSKLLTSHGGPDIFVWKLPNPASTQP